MSLSCFSTCLPFYAFSPHNIKTNGRIFTLTFHWTYIRFERRGGGEGADYGPEERARYSGRVILQPANNQKERERQRGRSSVG